MAFASVKIVSPRRDAVAVVVAGLVPAIHVFAVGFQDVDTRDERGYDESERTSANAASIAGPGISITLGPSAKMSAARIVFAG